MQKAKRILLLILIIILAFVALGCTTLDHFVKTLENDESDDIIKIGIYEPLSGVDQEGGSLEITGIELAHELYPTLLGKRVELIYADNKSDIYLAEAAAKELVNEGVDIVLGSYGNTLSLAGGEVFKQASIPAIAITNTNPLVTRGNPYYFRVTIVDSFQGVMAAKYVYNDLGLDSVVVMKAFNDDYGSALSQEFTEKLISLTGNNNAVQKTIEYISGAENFSKEISELKANEAKAVFLPGSVDDSISIVKQARDDGIDAVFIGTDLWHDESLLELAGSAADGLIFTTYFDAEYTHTERTAEFLSAYENKYGNTEDPDGGVALGFDAYILALDALQRKAETGNELRDVLHATRDFEGATGWITFDQNGDAIKSIAFITVENGKFIHQYTVLPEWK